MLENINSVVTDYMSVGTGNLRGWIFLFEDGSFLKIKGGFSSKEWMSSENLEKLSQIGTKPEILTQLAGLLYSNLAQVRFVLEAPTRDLALILDALRVKKSK